MPLRGFRLSPDDRVLLETKFAVDHPSELGVMVDKIAPDTVITAVERTYHVEASNEERHLWVRCCVCGTNRNHKIGFVVLLPDGRRATVGTHCGETKHDIHYKDYLEQFETRRDRARLLERVLAAFRHHDDVTAAIRAMGRDPGFLQLLRLRKSFTLRYAELWSLLVHWRDGRLILNRLVRDVEEEGRRDARLDQKLTSLATRLNLSRENPEHERRLLAELAGDPIASKEPIMVARPREFGRYYGVSFVTEIEELDKRVLDLQASSERSLADLDDRESGRFIDSELKIAVRRFTSIIKEAIALHDQATKAIDFLDPPNLILIASYGNKVKPIAAKGKLVFEGRALRQVGRPGSIDLRAPTIVSSTRRLEAVLAEFEGARAHREVA